MQAVVKTPRIEISVRGAAIPPRLMEVLKEKYGPELSLVEDDGDDLVDAFETQWYKGVKEKMTPGTVYVIIAGITASGLPDRQCS